MPSPSPPDTRPFAITLLLATLLAASALPVAAAADLTPDETAVSTEACNPRHGAFYQMQDGSWCVCPDPMKLVGGMPISEWWTACWTIPPILQLKPIEGCDVPQALLLGAACRP